MQRHLALELLKYRSGGDERLEQIKKIQKWPSVCPAADLPFIREQIEVQPELAHQWRPQDDYEFFQEFSNLIAISKFSHLSTDVQSYGDVLNILDRVCKQIATTDEKPQSDELTVSKKMKTMKQGSPSSSSATEEPLQHVTPGDLFASTNVYNNTNLCRQFDIGRGRQHDAHELFLQLPDNVLTFFKMKRLLTVKEMQMFEEGQIVYTVRNPVVATSTEISDEDIDLRYTADEVQHETALQQGLMQTTDRLIEAGRDENLRMRFETRYVLSFGELFMMQLVIFDEYLKKILNLVTWRRIREMRTLTDLNSKNRYLVAVVCHIGREVASGHYVTRLYFADDQVAIADDAHIIESARDNVTHTPYLLFYAPQLIPRSDYDLQGLENLGNTCFANSVMQAVRLALECRQQNATQKSV